MGQPILAAAAFQAAFGLRIGENRLEAVCGRNWLPHWHEGLPDWGRARRPFARLPSKAGASWKSPIRFCTTTWRHRALVDLAPAHAERLYVGKKKSLHAFTQEEICAMLIERARRGLQRGAAQGRRSLHLRTRRRRGRSTGRRRHPFRDRTRRHHAAGDRSLYGRPLTHRDHTSAVTFVTGHAVGEIDWGKVGLAETLVIFMGLTTFEQIARELIARGGRPRLPRWRFGGPRAPTRRPSPALATLPGADRAADEAARDDHRGRGGALA